MNNIISNFYFIAYYSTGDVFIPINYIIDFIEKYKIKYNNEYGKNNTKFIICSESRHHTDLKYYNKWFSYDDIIPYIDKNLYYENGNFYVYYWCKHIHESTSPTDVYGFAPFFTDLFKKFYLEINTDLSTYIPKLSLIPNIEQKKDTHYQQLIQSLNGKEYNKKKTIFFFNCDAISNNYNRKSGYNIDILLNLLAVVIKKHNLDYTIIASHKYDCFYEDNIIFLKDILNKEQNMIEIIDFQIQSYYSNIIIGAQTGVIILCQFFENKDKIFFMSYEATVMYQGINNTLLPKSYSRSCDIIIMSLASNDKKTII
jgi:hypothetical protein